jgi:hypothetical protein
MFFRRLNWNVVGWFRTVSLISYAVIARAFADDGLHSFTATTVPSHRAALGAVVHRRHRRHGQVHPSVDGETSRRARHDRRHRRARQHAREEPATRSRTSATRSRRRKTSATTPPSSGARSASLAPVDRAQSQIEAVGPSLSHEYLIKAARGAGHRDRDPVHLHRVPLRLELHLRFGRRDRARARRRDDDRHLRDRRQARRRRVLGRRADRHRLLGHGYDRHPRPDPRERQADGGRAVRPIVNTSILQTMTRSVNTLATVVITLVALLALRRREPAELRLRAAGRHLLGRLPLDLLLGAARRRTARTAAREVGGDARSQRAALERPRTVAEARAQRPRASREEILAARKAPRARRPAPACGRRRGRRAIAASPAAASGRRARKPSRTPKSRRRRARVRDRSLRSDLRGRNDRRSARRAECRAARRSPRTRPRGDHAESRRCRNRKVPRADRDSPPRRQARVSGRAPAAADRLGSRLRAASRAFRRDRKRRRPSGRLACRCEPAARRIQRRRRPFSTISSRTKRTTSNATGSPRSVMRRLLHEDRGRELRGPPGRLPGSCGRCRSSSNANPSNPHDSNAIAVRFGTLQLGYLRREIARRLAPNIDGGDRYSASVGSVTGGGERHIGVNIHVRRHRAPAAVRAEAPSRELASTATRDCASRLIGERPAARSAARRARAPGAGAIRSRCSARGAANRSAFQLPAAERALERGDEDAGLLSAARACQRSVRCARRAPEALRLAHPARQRCDRRGTSAPRSRPHSRTAAWDIILATPEFATYHRRRSNVPATARSWSSSTRRTTFTSRATAPAYGALGALVRGLGTPQVLALDGDRQRRSVPRDSPRPRASTRG